MKNLLVYLMKLVTDNSLEDSRSIIKNLPDKLLEDILHCKPTLIFLSPFIALYIDKNKTMLAGPDSENYNLDNLEEKDLNTEIFEVIECVHAIEVFLRAARMNLDDPELNLNKTMPFSKN